MGGYGRKTIVHVFLSLVYADFRPNVRVRVMQFVAASCFTHPPPFQIKYKILDSLSAIVIECCRTGVVDCECDGCFRIRAQWLMDEVGIRGDCYMNCDIRECKWDMI